MTGSSWLLLYPLNAQGQVLESHRSRLAFGGG